MSNGVEIYLIDTPVAIALFDPREVVLRERVRQETVSICVVTMGELLDGAQQSSHIAENLKKVQAIFEERRLLRFTKETINYYSQIREALYRARTFIPTKNLWIAALAIQHNMILVTRDPYFDSIPGLQHEAW